MKETHELKVQNKVSIDSLEAPIPSKLQDPNSREIKRRIQVLRNYAELNNIVAPKKFAEDEHYWFTALSNYLPITKILSEQIPKTPKAQKQKLGVTLSMRDAEKQVLKDQERLTDGLTGAWSRMALDNFLENLRRRPRNIEVGLIFFDIDKFKEHNDRYGHPKGDEILKNLVRELTIQVRPTDMVGRYGGDEFALVLPGIPSFDSFPAKAEQLRKAVTEKLGGLTLSIGLATMRSNEQSIENLYRRADKGCYAAKHLGSGRTTMLIDVTTEGDSIYADLTENIKYKEVSSALPDGKLKHEYVKMV